MRSKNERWSPCPATDSKKASPQSHEEAKERSVSIARPYLCALRDFAVGFERWSPCPAGFPFLSSGGRVNLQNSKFNPMAFCVVTVPFGQKPSLAQSKRSVLLTLFFEI